jgi:hypothetical protein
VRDMRAKRQEDVPLSDLGRDLIERANGAGT